MIVIKMSVQYCWQLEADEEEDAINADYMMEEEFSPRFYSATSAWFNIVFLGTTLKQMLWQRKKYDESFVQLSSTEKIADPRCVSSRKMTSSLDGDQ